MFSCGKAIAGAADLRLCEKGEIGLDARIADVWPEFGVHGKERTTLGGWVSPCLAFRRIWLKPSATMAPAARRGELFRNDRLPLRSRETCFRHRQTAMPSERYTGRPDLENATEGRTRP